MTNFLNFLSPCFTGSVLPASLLLTLVCIYWFLVVLGAVGLDSFDLDLDLDADADVSSILGLGAVGFRFLNLGMVPIMVWLSAFALSLWIVSMLFQLLGVHEDLSGWWQTSLVVGGNGLISLIPTKIFTQPLRGKFDAVPPNPDKDMIGRTGVVTTTVTATNGQVEIEAEGAPLVLHSRSREEEIAKGDRIVIVDYDSETRIFEVEKYSS